MSMLKDHVELGKELDLFCQSPIVGKGLPLMTPRGTSVLMVLKRFIEDEEKRRGYQYTSTPYLAQEDLYKISGHWNLYRDSMFLVPDSAGDDVHYLALRPMTCPFQFQIYNRKSHSYRDLPVRLAETSTLFRNEASGALHGLVRIRQFTLSEGHIICRPDQVEQEFLGALELTRYVMATIGITDYWYRFSTHDPSNTSKYIQDPEAWLHSETMLRSLLEGTGEAFTEGSGEAAFYGPKLDIQARDNLGREETLFTIQLDFALPRRFEMSYVAEDGSKQYPMVIHRSSIGCYERTLALLLELYQGRLPFWMSPEQVRVIVIGESAAEYARDLCTELSFKGIRCEIDCRSETLGRKIRDTRELQIPVMAVIGDRESGQGLVNVRLIEGNTVRSLTRTAFVEACVAADRSRNRWITLV
jgi:threonyl-tRNA synthetase